MTKKDENKMKKLHKTSNGMEMERKRTATIFHMGKANDAEQEI